MTLEFYRLPHFPSRLQVKGVIDPRVERPGIRTYSKWLGLFLKIFGLTERVGSSSKTYFVNKQSFLEWKERTKDQQKIQGEVKNPVDAIGDVLGKSDASASAPEEDEMGAERAANDAHEKESSVVSSLEDDGAELDPGIKAPKESDQETEQAGFREDVLPTPALPDIIEEEAVKEPLATFEKSSPLLGNYTIDFVGEAEEKPAVKEGEFSLKQWIIENGGRIRGIKGKQDKKNPLLMDDFLPLLSHTKELKSLHLVDAKVPESFFNDLLRLEHLETLDIKGNHISKEALQGILSGKFFPKLKHLDISRCGLQGAWIQEALQNSHVSLVSLKVSANQLDDVTFNVIIEGFPQLEVLHLNSNEITPQGMSAVFNHRHNNLKELRLSDNEIRDLGMLHLSEGLASFPLLKKVDVIGCGFENEPTQETLDRFREAGITLTTTKSR